jgi:Acyltransferase
VISESEACATLDRLTDINAEDILGALGLSRFRLARPLLELLCRDPARRFAREVLAYDSVVAQRGLAAGGEWASRHFVGRWSVENREAIPADGPLLIVSNHPGLYDTVLFFASIPRRDLLVIAADRPFLRALPATSRYLLLARDGAIQLGLLRRVVAYLRDGGAILTFPGGEIEPDPALSSKAVDALSRWTNSSKLFARLVPGLVAAPVVVSGVLSTSAQRHPLTRLRRAPKDREWLGAMLQLLLRSLARVEPTIAFGEPVEMARGPADSGSDRSSAVARAWEEVLRSERALIEAASRG